jgi:hypothetical protein
MNGVFEVVIVGRGQHGPFPPNAEEMVELEEKLGRALTPSDIAAASRTYLYSELAAVDGSGSKKFTHAVGLDELQHELFRPLTVVIDVRDNGRHKLVGLAPAKLKAAAA